MMYGNLGLIWASAPPLAPQTLQTTSCCFMSTHLDRKRADRQTGWQASRQTDRQIDTDRQTLHA